MLRLLEQAAAHLQPRGANFLEMGAECGLIEQTEPLHYYRP